jgi:hypothetical protein
MRGLEFDVVTQLKRRNPIRWIGKGPNKSFTRLPNELARDGSLSAEARSIAAYLWSHCDGWELSAKSIAAELRMDRGTVGARLEELSRHRWVAIHKTGQRSRQYFAYPARRLTEAEHASLTACGYADGTSMPDHEHVDGTGIDMRTGPATGMRVEPATKKTNQENHKKTNNNSSDVEVSDVTSSSPQDIEARKGKLRPKIRELVTTLLPSKYKETNHLTNLAAKMMAEDKNITLDMVGRALKAWDQEAYEPARLGNYISEELNNDPVPALTKVLANVRTRLLDDKDMDILYRLRATWYLHYPPDDVADEDEWMRQDQERHVEAKLHEAIQQREGTNQ